MNKYAKITNFTTDNQSFLGLFFITVYVIYDWNTVVSSLLILHSSIHKSKTVHQQNEPSSSWKWNMLLKNDTKLQAKILANQTRSKFLINLTHCQLEDIHPFDRRFLQIKNNFVRKRQIPCKGRPFSKFDDGILTIEPAFSQEYHRNWTSCHYAPFDMDPKSKDKLIFQPPVKIDIDKGTQINHPWILVESFSNKSIVYRNFHSQITPQKDYRGIPIRYLGENDFNVMLVILDSVSRLAWLRHCPEIHKFITDKLGGVLMKGHHVVGQNTYHNMYAILKGRKPIGDVKNIMLGEVDFIFSSFASNGFATFEAGNVLGLELDLPFDYKVKIESKEPLHTNRAFRNLHDSMMYIPNHNKQTDSRGPTCFGGTNIANQSLNQAIEFHTKYSARGKKSMSLVHLDYGLHTHQDHNGLSRDKHLLMGFVHRLESSGIAKNTIIFLGSDHGCRFNYFKSYVGRHESRLPLMYGIFPKDFHEKYPSAVRNFKFNSKHRVTSQYDMYYTFKALADIGSLSDPMYSPWLHFGMNLFVHVPSDRSCNGAGVSENFCACGIRMPLKTTDPRAKQAAHIFLTEVNKLIKNVDCVQFDKFDIIEVYMMQPKGDITLTIHTRPVVAKLRTTLALDGSKVLLSDIERLEHYAPVTTCMTKEQMLSKDGATYGNVCVCKNDAWKVTTKT